MVGETSGSITSGADGGNHGFDGRIPRRRGVAALLKTGYCSRTLLQTIDRAYENPLIDEERASVPLCAGIMGNGYQCGMVWGSALAAGARACQVLGPGPRAQTGAIRAAQGIVESFRTQNKTIECAEIAGIDLLSASAIQTVAYILRGGPIRCFRMAAGYPSVAFDQIEATISAENGEARRPEVDGAPIAPGERDAGGGEVPAAPVGCAALLAQRMGASEMHTVMAAGLAGGIGLSGSACGALGTAVWLACLESLEEGARKIPYKPSQGVALVERFLGCRGGEFRCSKIVGRAFESVDDHADFIRGGGCREIIEALAAAE